MLISPAAREAAVNSLFDGGYLRDCLERHGTVIGLTLTPARAEAAARTSAELGGGEGNVGKLSRILGKRSPLRCVSGLWRNDVGVVKDAIQEKRCKLHARFVGSTAMIFRGVI